MSNARGLMAPNVAKTIERAKVNLPGVVEVIWQPLYDYQTKVAAAVAAQTFFQTPLGQGAKTLSQTNMELAGSLPKGQNFVITGIQVEVLPILDITNATAFSEFANDIYSTVKGGALSLRIGSKEFIRQGNLMKFPPVNRLYTEGSYSDSTADTAGSLVYTAAVGREFSVVDLLLTSNQNFNVQLLDLAAISADCTIGVTLNGYLLRNAQ